MLRFRPVLTPFGGAVFIIVSILLVRSLLGRNSYEIVIASSVLLLFLILFIAGAWKSKKLKAMEPSWKPPFPMTACPAANAGEDEQLKQLTQINGLDTSIPLFFRLHFFIKGRFFPCGFKFSQDGKGGCPVSVETSVPRNDASSELQMDFPISGIFFGEGFFRLNDIFGFFSFPSGKPQQKTVNVRSAPCFGKKTYINPQSGAEDRRNKPASDIERYHMREYTPGDLFRDINWKSSDKFDTLITRISTDNQEKISRIEIYLRNYANSGIGNLGSGIGRQKAAVYNMKAKKRGQIFSLEELWLLDRSKAQLMYFIRSLMEQSPSFIFDVRSAGKNWEIENQNDLDSFFEELSGLSFFPPQNEIEMPAGSGDIYVFSTACDSGLPAFLMSCNQRPLTLFLVQPGERKVKSGELKVENKKIEIKSEDQRIETEKLYIRDFAANGCYVSAGLLKRGKLKPLSVRAGKTEMFYAQVKS